MKISPETEKICFFATLLFLLVLLLVGCPMFVVGVCLGMSLEEKLSAIMKWYNDIKRKRGW